MTPYADLGGVTVKSVQKQAGVACGYVQCPLQEEKFQTTKTDLKR